MLNRILSSSLKFKITHGSRYEQYRTILTYGRSSSWIFEENEFLIVPWNIEGNLFRRNWLTALRADGILERTEGRLEGYLLYCAKIYAAYFSSGTNSASWYQILTIIIEIIFLFRAFVFECLAFVVFVFFGTSYFPGISSFPKFLQTIVRFYFLLVISIEEIETQSVVQIGTERG